MYFTDFENIHLVLTEHKVRRVLSVTESSLMCSENNVEDPVSDIVYLGDELGVR